MCCSNDTAAATGIFTPHLEISASPPPFVLVIFYSFAFIPSIQSLNFVRVSPSKNRLDRIHAAEIHQCTIAPQLHSASTNKEGKEKI